MSLSRKDFFKTICISGACFCGFSSMAIPAAGSINQNNSTEESNSKEQLLQAWIAQILTNINSGLNEAEIRKVMKSCALVHYNDLKMDDLLAGYKGDLEKFISWIEENWGWKIEYNKEAKTLIADENKSYCVCPMVNHQSGSKLPAMCFCSEGFAEKMFSTVVGVPVTASVVSSILRGDKSCKYKIVFNS
jgi:hypothetical protein